jgi:glycosyltransferase involved in cell wall biosynthesis
MAEDQRISPPRVSIALCSYNGGGFITQQLESIVGQTRPADEIVVCDDGSTDSTQEEVRRFPVQFEVNPQRLGVTANFQKAISQCTGDIIFLSDQDDLWKQNKIARLLECFADESIGLAFSNGEVVGENLSPAGYGLWESIWFDAAEQQRMRRGESVPVLLRHAVAAGSTLAFRAKFLPLILPIPDFPHSHDIWITLLIGCVARLEPVDEELIRYRLHSFNHVGLRRHGLLSQIRMARQQIRAKAFAYAADLHEAARERLIARASQFPVNECNLALLDEKICHSRLRDGLPSGWFSRLGVIKTEWRNGNYAKYSYGYKSVLQDLILR